MNIKQIKEKYTCLDYLGAPLKKVANGYLYRCPWRTDTNPSLSISLNGKGWHDLATDEHGNLIDLVCRVLNTTDFKRVCATFDDPSSFPSTSTTNVTIYDKGKEKVTSFTSFEVVPLSKWPLKKYLEDRGVSADIAIRFGVKEAHYSFKSDQSSYLYALAYPNNKGGYELRGAPYKDNPGYKGGTSPKGITTHVLRPDAPWVVMEGFFDMLSWVVFCKGWKQNLLVLNSCAMAEDAITYLKEQNATEVHLYLDNDAAGNSTTKKMLKALPGAVDHRTAYKQYNDVNDYLLSNQRYRR